jgi:hypothetical protein
MLPTPSPHSPIVFPDPHEGPTGEALKRVLGEAFDPLAEVLARLCVHHANAACEWTYSHTAGWYLAILLGRRHVCQVEPRRDDFRLLVVLDDAALAELDQTPHAAQLLELRARGNPEANGTLFSFDASSCDPALVEAMVMAKRPAA